MTFCKKSVLFSVVTAMTLFVSTSFVQAEETHDMSQMKMPAPTAEHTWLQQFVGKWETENEGFDPIQKTTVKSKGTENIQPVGQFWITNEINGTMMEKPFKGVSTLGYDAEKKKYISTWVDSMTGKLWQYEGQVDPSGKKLTLETEGECPMQPGKVMKFKDIIEVQDNNHNVYTSSILDENGQWTTMFTSRATRKK